MNSLQKIRKIGVLGVGLIGGSFALAIRRAVPHIQIVGLARAPASLAPAQTAGLIQDVRPIAADSVRDLDVLLLAAPVAATQAALLAVVRGLPGDVVISDVGSTKSDVVQAARLALGAHYPRFVAAHPIAGSEQSGWQAADIDLYVGRRVILTPDSDTAPDATGLVNDLWQACGARVTRLEAAQHDQIFAQVSHFPHLLAFAYMQQILCAADADVLLREAGSGFRDFTRLAGSEPAIWVDICRANQVHLRQCVSDFQRSLAELLRQLEAPDAQEFTESLMRISQKRRDWSL